MKSYEIIENYEKCKIIENHENHENYLLVLNRLTKKIKYNGEKGWRALAKHFILTFREKRVSFI